MNFKNLIGLVAICVLLLPLAAGAQSSSANFVRLESKITYACALRDSDKAVLPARIVSSNSARFVDKKWITSELKSVRASLRLSAKRKRAASYPSRAELLLREKVLNRFSSRCAAMSRAACNNKIKDPFEIGVDCGGPCSTQCAIQPIPSAIPTVIPGMTPQPIQTSLPTPGGVPAIDPTVVASPTATPTSTPTATPFQPVPRPSLLENTECSDGIDNDGDGQIDIGAGNINNADFGCFGPNGQESNQDYGFTLANPSNDTRIVYVSSSEGNDANSGLSALAPKRTLYAAHRALRSGSPDWMLLKRGDTFDGADYQQRLGRELGGSNTEGDYTWYLDGRSPSEPMVLASYGTSTVRPIIIASSALTDPAPGRVGLYITTQKNLLVSGLDFYAAACDPSSQRFAQSGCPPGVRIYAGSTDITIEDNRVRFFGSGINVENSGPNADQKWDNILVRRNVVERNYHPFTHSQGIYTSGAGRLRISQNVLYKNGWNDSTRMVLIPATFNGPAWRSVTDGRITFVLNGTTVPLSGMNFSGVSNYADVAQVIESKLQQTVPSANVTLRFTGRQITIRSSLPSTEEYTMLAGPSGGINIGASAFLNVFVNSQTANPRHTAATIYNRNMYLTKGYSNTTVDGNVTSRGASGGIQLRMGGRIFDNLTLAEPVGISVGHAENPVGVSFWAHIADNVLLGAMDISAQPRGFGIGFGGQYFLVERNIIANNEEGTGNVQGLFSDTDTAIADVPYTYGTIKDNIVYNWKASSGAGASMGLIHRAFDNVLISDNYFIQPYGGAVIGYATTSPLVGLGYETNTVYSSSFATPFSIGNARYTAPQFQSLAGGNFVTSNPPFADPLRTISTYMNDFNLGTPSVDGFMDRALGQSKFNWQPELSAYRVGDYIRDGFELPGS